MAPNHSIDTLYAVCGSKIKETPSVLPPPPAHPCLDPVSIPLPLCRMECRQILEQHQSQGRVCEDGDMETFGETKETLCSADDEHRGKILQGQQLLCLSSPPEARGLAFSWGEGERAIGGWGCRRNVCNAFVLKTSPCVRRKTPPQFLAASMRYVCLS